MSNPALRIAASGMAAQQTRTEVIAHNLANVNTVSFKRSTAQFEDLLYQTVRGPQAVNSPDAQALGAVQVGRGVRLAAVTRMDGQGALQSTGRPLDLAIEGEGYLQVQLPSGDLAYTRHGSLQVSDQGVLVTSDGYTVLPSVTLPQGATGLTIGKNGIVSVTRDGSNDAEEIGRIELARFLNPSGLVALGGSLYGATAQAGAPILGYAEDAGFGRIEQGSLEASNVEVVQEMVSMIEAQRGYELAAKTIRAAEQMAEVANGLLR